MFVLCLLSLNFLVPSPGSAAKQTSDVQAILEQINNLVFEQFKNTRQFKDPDVRLYNETADALEIDEDDVVYRLDQAKHLLISAKERYNVPLKPEDENHIRTIPFASAWPEQTVLYEFAGKFTDEQTAIVKTALEEWQSRTCVQFKLIPQGEEPPKPYVVFLNKNLGGTDKECSTQIGFNSKIKKHEVYLSDVCFQNIPPHGIILHIIGHVLGLYHEHQRPDTRNYIVVYEDNARRNHYYKFMPLSKLVTIANTSIFDVQSIMHFQPYAFSRDYRNWQPIWPSGEKEQTFIIGQRSYLSFNDIKKINHLYRCTVNTKLGCKPIICDNGGYQSPFKCDDCVCPFPRNPVISDRYCRPAKPKDVTKTPFKFERTSKMEPQAGSFSVFAEKCNLEISLTSNMRCRPGAGIYLVLCKDYIEVKMHWVDDLSVPKYFFCNCNTSEVVANVHQDNWGRSEAFITYTGLEKGDFSITVKAVSCDTSKQRINIQRQNRPNLYYIYYP